MADGLYRMFEVLNEGTTQSSISVCRCNRGPARNVAG